LLLEVWVPSLSLLKIVATLKNVKWDGEELIVDESAVG